ncbi:MAG: hypothetical protein FWD61_04865 [Phycisphaerales bacterium]|nr:hypothetical protein [Phycisphaerales bacterium]
MQTPEKPPILSYTNLKHPTLTEPLMRSGPYLVTTFGKHTLPPICPICGHPGNDKSQLLRINTRESFTYATVQLMSRYVFLTAFFCDHHYKIRRRANTLSIVFICVTILSLVFIMFARLAWEPSLFWIITAACLAAISALAVGISQVVATRGPHRYRTKPGYAILKNVHPNLLAQLPALPRILR